MQLQRRERLARRAAVWAAVALLSVARAGACDAISMPATDAIAAAAAHAAWSNGHTAPGYLGIDVRDVAEEQITALKLKDGRGAVIVRVDHDGPAGKMGLREHDVVLLMNGTAIEGEEQMRRLLHEMGPGHAVTLVVNRSGQEITLTTQMAIRAQVEHQAWVDHLAGPQAPASGLPGGDGSMEGPVASSPPPAGGRYSRSFLGSLLSTPTYTGAVLEKLGPQLAGFFGVQNGEGLLVRSVENNSPAAMAGMQAGDVMVRANAHALDSPSQWLKVVKEAKGSPITVVVLRDKTEKTLTLTPDAKRRASVETAPSEGRAVASLTEL